METRQKFRQPLSSKRYALPLVRGREDKGRFLLLDTGSNLCQLGEDIEVAPRLSKAITGPLAKPMVDASRYQLDPPQAGPLDWIERRQDIGRGCHGAHASVLHIQS
jgi:hypothetical protein